MIPINEPLTDRQIAFLRRWLQMFFNTTRSRCSHHDLVNANLALSALDELEKWRDDEIHPDDVCRRCGGGIPNDSERGRYPGTLSRLDHQTYICSQCGSDEALFEFFNPGQELPPLDRPILGYTMREKR